VGWEAIYRVVQEIPTGRVMTYGQVAARAGMVGAARQVGWALAALGSRDDVPWQRVINARGEISDRGEPEWADLQRGLLESEGVELDARGRVDLERFGWPPRSAATHRPGRGSPRAARAGVRKGAGGR
jgi:methylated-DNA-protein-cysteine methyltransferase-like protein